MKLKKYSLLFPLLMIISGLSGTLHAQETFPVNGVKDEKSLYYFFSNATIITEPGKQLEDASLLVRNGKIEAVGKNIQPPKGAVVYDLKGKFIYPSLIEVYSDYGMPEIKKAMHNQNQGPQLISNTRGAFSWNQAIKPETDASRMFGQDGKKGEELRNLGFGLVVSHQQDGIMRGTGVCALLTDERDNKAVVRDQVASFYSFDKGASTQDFPSSLMGAIALIRQTYHDAKWYSKNPATEFNMSLNALNKLNTMPQIFEARDKLDAIRISRIGDEFGIRYIIKGSGDEYQRIDELKKTGSALIIPVNYPAAFDLDDPYEATQVTLGDMKHWELAPANLSAVQSAGIRFAITSADLKDKKEFWKNIRKAIENGLTDSTALQAITVTPAELMGLTSLVGSITVGKMANFLITSSRLFEKDMVIYENWVNGKLFTVNNMDVPDLRGNYVLKMDGQPDYKFKVEGEFLSPKATLEVDTAKVKVILTRNNTNLVTLSFEGKNLGMKGQIRLAGRASTKDKDARVDMEGTGQLPDGRWVGWKAVYQSAYIAEAKKDTIQKPSPNGKVTFPNKAYGFSEQPASEPVLFKNATIWTNEKEGTLQKADILIDKGKIVKVASVIDPSSIKTPGLKIVDATGKHITPGIIDEHSHIGISRGVNEGTQAVTSEVRIGDVINPDDVNIYRQLAGGVTTIQQLHGSANPVGGQSSIIKLRWGAGPEQMKLTGAPGFIKFALGENVKQANWGDRQTIRFPQTRMGVEQVYVDAFTRAREYENIWKKFNALSSRQKSMTTPPRRDLELDALVEILNGKRHITCHSYVQSEINMLMKVADSMGFRVNTFTHILEGYKVADKMKKHGVAASSFSDWWGYKYEVTEAIPYNGAILSRLGVITAFNSDDAEMARRLNQEAAKAVKYGRVSEQEALKFVTLNPAKMLHIDHQTGSLKPGKDADLVVWSDHPLSQYSKAEQTYVDGVLYFDIQRDQMLRKEIEKERARLIQKMNEARQKGEKTRKPDKEEPVLYHCETLEGEEHDHGHHH
jgi:imidazolonepropionase-like amidohydrolase